MVSTVGPVVVVRCRCQRHGRDRPRRDPGKVQNGPGPKSGALAMGWAGARRSWGNAGGTAAAQVSAKCPGLDGVVWYEYSASGIVASPTIWTPLKKSVRVAPERDEVEPARA